MSTTRVKKIEMRNHCNDVACSVLCIKVYYTLLLLRDKFYCINMARSPYCNVNLLQFNIILPPVENLLYCSFINCYLSVTVALLTVT